MQAEQQTIIRSVTCAHMHVCLHGAVKFSMLENYPYLDVIDLCQQIYAWAAQITNSAGDA